MSSLYRRVIDALEAWEWRRRSIWWLAIPALMLGLLRIIKLLGAPPWTMWVVFAVLYIVWFLWRLTPDRDTVRRREAALKQRPPRNVWSQTDTASHVIHRDPPRRSD